MKQDYYYYHIYTKGIENFLIFQDREDYKAGMNYIAIATERCSVVMIAFTLMSNHFHFVVWCRHEDAIRFINLYKQLISTYLRGKYGISKALYLDKASCKKIDLQDEGLKKTIAYVLNNPVKAGINCLPQNYEWGSCNCYFSNIDRTAGLVPLKDIGTREVRKILHSKHKPKETCYLNPAGYIDPASYVNIKFVEELFRKAGSFEYFLNSCMKADRKDMPIAYSDTIVHQCLKEILEKQYDSVSVEDLSAGSVKKIILHLRSRLGCPVKQIARIMRLEIRDVMKALEP